MQLKADRSLPVNSAHNDWAKPPVLTWNHCSSMTQKMSESKMQFMLQIFALIITKMLRSV